MLLEVIRPGVIISSLPQIGQVFGNRDHTTVLHGCDKVAASVKDTASGMASVVGDIKNLIAEGM